jgi:hypothetical protein
MGNSVYFNIAGVFYRELQGVSAENKIGDLISRRDKITTDPVLVSNMLDEYTWTEVAQPYYISCSDPGATQRIVVTLLNEDYLLEQFSVELTGQTKIQIDPENMMRFLFATNEDSTSLNGDVWIYEDTTLTGGVPDDLTKARGGIKAPFKDSRMAVATVPANYGASLYFIETKPFGTQLNRKGTIEVLVREAGEVFELKSTLPFQLQSGNPENILQMPWLLRPKTDLMIQAQTEFGVTALSIRVSIMFRTLDRFHFTDRQAFADEAKIN